MITQSPDIANSILNNSHMIALRSLTDNLTSLKASRFDR